MLTPSRLLHRFGCAVLLLASALLTLSCSKQPSSDDAITVYSARAEHLISPLFDRYTQETGIEIRYITDNAGALIQRLKAEGSHSPADILLTVDAEVVQRQALAHIVAEDNDWTGLSVRRRTLSHSTGRVVPSELSTYDAFVETQC